MKTFLFLSCCVSLLSASTCLAVNEGLDIHLAFSIAQPSLDKLDYELLPLRNVERISAIKRCYKALKEDDLSTASKELKVSCAIAAQARNNKDDMLCELEAVAGAAISLSKCNLDEARNLLPSLPPKPMPDAEANEVTSQRASDYSYLRVRLLCAAGRYRDAHNLIGVVYQERINRLGVSHEDTFTSMVDLLDIALITTGEEAIYSSSERCYHLANKHTTGALPNELAAIHARVLMETERYEEAIKLAESHADKCGVKQNRCKADLLTTASLSYHNLGQNNKALSVAQKVCEMSQASAHVDQLLYHKSLYALGNAQMALEQFPDANLTLDKLSSSIKELKIVQINRMDFMRLAAEMIFRLGRTEQAIAVLQKVHKDFCSRGWQGPAKKVAFQLGHYLYMSDRYVEAFEWLEKCEPQEPKEQLGTHLVMYCSCLKKMGEWEQCYAALNPLKDKFNSVQDAREVALAEDYALSVGHCGNWPEAVLLSKAILKQVSAQPFKQGVSKEESVGIQMLAWQTLIKSQVAARDDTTARQSLDGAIRFITEAAGRQHPSLVWLLNQQGKLAMRQQRYSDAKSLFTEAANLCKEQTESSLAYRKASSNREKSTTLASGKNTSDKGDSIRK